MSGISTPREIIKKKEWEKGIDGKNQSGIFSELFKRLSLLSQRRKSNMFTGAERTYLPPFYGTSLLKKRTPASAGLLCTRSLPSAAHKIVGNERALPCNKAGWERGPPHCCSPFPNGSFVHACMPPLCAERESFLPLLIVIAAVSSDDCCCRCRSVSGGGGGGGGGAKRPPPTRTNGTGRGFGVRKGGGGGSKHSGTREEEEEEEEDAGEKK